MNIDRHFELGPRRLPNMHDFAGYVRFILSRKSYKSKIRVRQIRDSKRK